MMKGQYFSFDAIIASVIFVLALVALLSYWHSVKSFLDFQDDSLSREAVRISNLLFAPPSFKTALSSDCGNMDQLGFALSWDDRRVNSSVIQCAASKDQAWLREALGASSGVLLEIKYVNKGTYLKIGGDVPESTANIVKIRRLATIVNSTTGDTDLAYFDLSLYTEPLYK